jgi:hypothetical protein
MKWRSDLRGGSDRKAGGAARTADLKGEGASLQRADARERLRSRAIKLRGRRGGRFI